MFGRAGLLTVVLLASTAGGQVRLERRTPSGPRVGMGVVQPDRAAEARAQRQACDERIAAAREHLAAERWAEARATLDRARRIAADTSQISTIRSLYQQVDSQGQRQLTQAKQAYGQGRYVDALASFEAIRRTFGWLPSGKAAGEAIKLAETDPAAQAAVQESKAAAMEGLVERILTGIGPASAAASGPSSEPGRGASSQPASSPSRIGRIKELPVEKQARVVDMLERIAETFRASPTGRRAAEDLESLRADKAFSDRLAGYRKVRQAEAAIKKAHLYRDSGMTDKAVQFYKQVVLDFPGTEQAAAAKGELAALE